MEELSPTAGKGLPLALSDLTEKEVEWELNHIKIGNFIADYVHQYGNMPSKTMIAGSVELSRETVYKHLKAYAENPLKQEHQESFGMMAGQVLSQVLRAALSGDMSAAKLYLETSKTVNEAPGTRKMTAQQNYVQINNTVINQQIIQQLRPEQLERIEQFIAKELEEKQA